MGAGGVIELWDERDGFFYDVLCTRRRHFEKFRVRSLVGLIPLFAVERLEEDWIEPFKEFRRNFHWFLENRQDIVQRCVTTVEHDGKRVHVLAIVNPEQMRGLLERVWDPAEFRSEYGLRSLSKFHERHPFRFGGAQVGYEPAASRRDAQGRQLQLARAGLVPDRLPDDRVAAQARQGLRPAVRGREPRPRRAARQARRDGARVRRPADSHLHARRGRAAGPYTAGTKSSSTTRTGAT